MGKNRDRISIIAAILEVAYSGANKTRIMFNANLSFKLLEKYLDVVVESGFVCLEGSKYHLSERGRVFLKRYRAYAMRYVEAQKLLEDLGCERDELDLMCEVSRVRSLEAARWSSF